MVRGQRLDGHRGDLPVLLGQLAWPPRALTGPTAARPARPAAPVGVGERRNAEGRAPGRPQQRRSDGTPFLHPEPHLADEDGAHERQAGGRDDDRHQRCRQDREAKRDPPRADDGHPAGHHLTPAQDQADRQQRTQRRNVGQHRARDPFVAVHRAEDVDRQPQWDAEHPRPAGHRIEQRDDHRDGDRPTIPSDSPGDLLHAERAGRPAASFAGARRPPSVPDRRAGPQDAACHHDDLVNERPCERRREAHARRPSERCTDKENGRVRHDGEESQVCKQDRERDGHDPTKAHREPAPVAVAAASQHRGAHDGAEQ